MRGCMARCLIFGLSFLFIAKICLAEEFYYREGEKIKADIAADIANRISLGRMPIATIAGDESKYNVVVDNKARHIFLTPKVNIGEIIEISIIDIASHVVDLQLTAREIESQIIKINKKEASEKEIAKIEEEEIIKMMKSMLAGKHEKYYVKEVNRDLPLMAAGKVSVKQTRFYGYGNLSGAVLLVKNNSKENYELRDSDFMNLFQNIVSMNIQKRVLKPKSSTKIFIISQEL